MIKPSIVVEGLGMFKTLLGGFNNARTFIDKRFSYFPEYPRVRNYRECFKEFLENNECALIIAPQDDFLLYNLIKEVEKSKSENLGSDAKSTLITSDKFLTYEKLRGISMPKTYVYNAKSVKLDFPFVAKPRLGVGGEGIFLVKNEKELEKIPKEGYMAQEFVEGKSYSASTLVGKEIKILSINTQEIKNFKYFGAKIPVNLKNKEELLRAIERIKGLHGYVGIDFILKDGEICIIEINARPTSSIIGLNKVFGFNISDLILKNHYDQKIPEFKPKKKVFLTKVMGKPKESFVSFKDYSFVLKELKQI